ncbi:MAG: glucose-6-phosphate dehydrogenase assembly protein OpcA [Thermoanaerobaculia bacterium]
MNAEDLNRALSGEDLRVDVSAIEKNLSALWREEWEDDAAAMRAALWNVVAHTSDDSARGTASETLSSASVRVPQRSIVVCATPHSDPMMDAWITANCHLVRDGGRVCSEEISIRAGGSRVRHVPPLVNALLVPEMPVATWWLGDLPSENESYLKALFEPVDRLIVDSADFDDISDIRFVGRMGIESNTSLADLNWARLDEWREATASIFDPPHMRQRLRMVRRIRVVTGVSGRDYFGEDVAALLYLAWLIAQTGMRVETDGTAHGASGAVRLELERQRSGQRGILFVEIRFDDESSVTVERHEESGRLVTHVAGIAQCIGSVTPSQPVRLEDLVVRELARSAGDEVFHRALPVAVEIARPFLR